LKSISKGSVFVVESQEDKPAVNLLQVLSAAHPRSMSELSEMDEREETETHSRNRRRSLGTRSLEEGTATATAPATATGRRRPDRLWGDNLEKWRGDVEAAALAAAAAAVQLNATETPRQDADPDSYLRGVLMETPV
jgi:hypothetical protein